MPTSLLPIPPEHAAKAPTQMQLCYAAQRQVADVNSNFMWLVKNGLTREDLARNIERRPSLWKRFEGFLDKLPSREIAVAA